MNLLLRLIGMQKIYYVLDNSCPTLCKRKLCTRAKKNDFAETFLDNFEGKKYVICKVLKTGKTYKISYKAFKESYEEVLAKEAPTGCTED